MAEQRSLRALAQVLVIAAGLVAIVGSGGGISIGFPPCPESLCPTTPPVPTVTIEPNVATAQVGSVVVFSAVTSNASGVPLVWQRSTDGGVSWQTLAGATGSTLQVGPVNLADDGLRLRATIQGSAAAQLIPARLAVSRTPGIDFADSEFVASDWQRIELPLLQQTTAQQVSDVRDIGGGTPGAFRRMSARLSSPTGGARVLYLWQGATFDPRTQGAIRHVDHSEACIRLNPSDVRGTTVYAAFEQGGRRYQSNLISGRCADQGWGTTTLGGLEAADFRIVAGPACGAGESCPDFSAAGGPIRFGHLRENLGQAADTIEHGVDNWKVTVWRR